MRDTLITLSANILNYDVSNIDWSDYSSKVEKIHRALHNEEGGFTGWLNSPLEPNDGLLVQIENVAKEIRSNADVLIVIGIGGSFLGARAVQEALTPYFGTTGEGIEVIYVGQNMSGAYVKQLIESLGKKSVVERISWHTEKIRK